MKSLIPGFLGFSLACVSAGAVRAQTLPPTLRPASPSKIESGKTPSALAAETEEPEVDQDDVIRVNTNLITVPAEVMDRNGRYIGNLRKQDFQLYEDGVEQQLSYFASVKQPFTVALLLDVSGSTQTRLQAIRAAANAFLSRLRPNDRLLIVTFDGRITVLTEAVTLGELKKRKLRIDAKHDGTLLYDAVGMVLNERLARMPGRKAIVLFTDGVDLGSKQASFKRNVRDAEERDVIIYAVQFNTLPELPARLGFIADPKTRERVQARMVKEYGVGSQYLRTLSERTGGRLYNADGLADIQKAFGLVTEDLGRQYSLGYYPRVQSRPGERRDIKVRVRLPNLAVRARESYITNTASSKQGGQE